MEEDIKIIEELIKNEHGELLNCWDYGEEAKKTLENLLTRYKQLEEDNKELRRYYASRTEVEDLKETISCLHESGKDYIHKSKIKEKIEELKNESYQISLKSEVAFDSGIMKNNLKIKVLQELLEEE